MTVEITWMDHEPSHTFTPDSIRVDEHRQLVLSWTGGRVDLKIPLDNVRIWTASK
jgi:hypothetical protein